MLELKGVKKVYYSKSGPVNAINGLDLSFPDKGMVFVVGKSGCGKTTLLNVIGGLDGIDEGEISVLGTPFSKFTAADYDAYRNTFIGFIFQEYNLLPEFTVEKNIRIAMELQGGEVNEAELDELLRTVEIEGLRNRKPNELSGGQRQRVAIARALLKKPRIIMADEPTGALDSNTGIQVFDILKKLSKEKLVIVVSHDQESAEKYADRIIRLVDGNIEEDSLYSDVEVETNLKEGDDSLIIKDGADLSENEKNIVASAIKNKKKLEVIEKLSFREKVPYQESELSKETHEQNERAELKKSKMKLKSSIALGMKSLTVKPFRLVLTILLSAIAFAVFGLFDALASFNTLSVIRNQLKKFDSDTVTIGAEYMINGEYSDIYGVKFTDKAIKELEQNTGYQAKGIFDFNDNTGWIKGVEIPIDPVHKIENLSGGIGNGYYQASFTGLIEFSREEFFDFGYDMVCGTYPESIVDSYGRIKSKFLDRNGKVKEYVYDMQTEEHIYKIAISNYLAESILYFLGGSGMLEGEYIESIEDLENKVIKIGGREFRIEGIVDCGEIPDKFKALSSTGAYDQRTELLLDDFKTFLDNGAYRCMFVGDGYLQAINTNGNGANIYYSGNSDWQIRSGSTDSIEQGQKYVYSSHDYDDDNIALFTGENFYGNIKLEDNQVLIHGENLRDLFYDDIRALDQTNKAKANELINILSGSVETTRTYEDVLKEFLEVVSYTKSSKRIDVTKTSHPYIVNKKLEVVGIYHGIDTDRGVAEEYRLMINKNLMEDFKIYTEQGEYNRVLLSGRGTNKGRKFLATQITNLEGYRLKWYGNNALELVKENAPTMKEASELFLYIALVLAVFSVFMFFNYISTSIVNKRRSIGVLRGLGSKSRDIFTMFTSESLVISIINAVLSIGLAALGCIFVNMYIRNKMFIPIAFAIFGFRQVGIILGLSILTAVISSLLPIIRIAKEKPVDLIRKN